MSTPNPLEDELPPETEEPEFAPEETDDGGAIIKLEGQEEKSIEELENFYANLVDHVDSSELKSIADELLIKIKRDLTDREDRDKKYEEGIKRTGLGNDAPGGAAFQGANKASHPMITKAVIAYMSSTIKELLPANGPVKTQILGKVTQDRWDKADRKKNYMNWQCTKKMPEFRNEMEQGLTQESLDGVFYMMLVWDHRKKRPVPLSVNPDDLILPSAASSFYTADRVTRREKVTAREYKSRVRSGEWVDIDLIPPSAPPEQTKAEQANEKITGVTQNIYNQDGVRTIYHVMVDLEIEDEYLDLGPLPYIIQIDEISGEVPRLMRNWEEKDETYQTMYWIVEFPFIPWRGPYPVGLIHLIGMLAGAATGAMRALLDSAHVNNLPTLLKLKGANTIGQSIELPATGVIEIEGSTTGVNDDIRKLMMAVPFNPPSATLYQLLGFLAAEGEDVVKVSMDMSDQSVNQMPVGTTLALIEQGLKVLSAIHGRQHASMARVLEILHRINRMYLTDEDIYDDTGEFLCYRSDFEGAMDVIPVSDPEIFSDVQRYAQMQLIEQRAQVVPQLYDLRKVEQLILRRTKIPDAEDLLAPSQSAEEMNAVNENVALALGRPVTAYPDQDHLAHIGVLLDFLTSPNLGQLPIIAPSFIPGALNHLKEHIVLWYVSYMEKASSAAVESDITDMMQYKDTETRQELDKLLATVSSDLEGGTQAASNKAFQKIPAIIQQAQQIMQQYSNPGAALQNTPQVAVAQIRSQDEEKNRQIKTQEMQQNAQQKDADRQTRMQEVVISNQAQDQRASRDMVAQAASNQAAEENRLREAQMSEIHEDSRTQESNETKERINQADNATAIEISDAEIEAGKHSNISTGTGIGKHESNP